MLGGGEKYNIPSSELLYKDEVYAVIGVAMQVYNPLGYGFLESVYQETISVELTKREIPFKSMEAIPVYYSAQNLKTNFIIADFLAYKKIIIEIKAIKQLASTQGAQHPNYLKHQN